ncbi:hypothetical protein D9M69_579460 [compost metagenome]
MFGKCSSKSSYSCTSAIIVALKRTHHANTAVTNFNKVHHGTICGSFVVYAYTWVRLRRVVDANIDKRDSAGCEQIA